MVRVPVLKIDRLSKSYGSITAVQDLSINVEAGQVYGVLGPNGSGKTTTLGVILGVLRQDVGTYSWFGEEPHSAVRKRIGSLLETPNFYPYLSAIQNLRIACDIKGVPRMDIDRVLDIVNLSGRGTSGFRTYSLGMKQRLAIASALLGDPEVLVLDEPTNGLDPEGIADIRAIIKKVASAGKTIVVASHILAEVERICTHVGILREGRLLKEGAISSVLGTNDQVIIASADMDILKVALNDQPKVGKVEEEGGRFLVTLREGMASAQLSQYLVERGIVLTEITVKQYDLESKFLELVKGE